jgi:hypothetical protein
VRVLAAAVGSILVGLVASAPAAAQTWEELEARQATIAGIAVVVADVFDVTRPAENTWIGRTANAIHIRTRRTVVERELLFRAGDRVDARRIRETERNLRAQPFIRDAHITPSRVSGAAVWARVDVVDAWSLRGSGSLRREGGRTAWSAAIDEVNLLGRGKRFRIAHASDRERQTYAVSFADPQLLGSRWGLSLSLADLSDGVLRSASLERPFFSIETRRAAGAAIQTSEYRLTQYHGAAPIYVLPVRTSAGALFASRAFVTAGRTALRVGLRYDAAETTFGSAIAVAPTAVPAPVASVRRLRGPSVTSSVVQDRPVTFRNLASIGLPEDYNVGWLLGGRVGYFAVGLGSTAAATLGAVDLRKGWHGGRTLWLAGAGIQGRRETGAWRDTTSRAGLIAYYQHSPWQTLAANLQMTAVAGPEPDGWLYLDSGAGLRGYPDHFLAGDRRVALSVEDRIVTEWQLVGLLQVGFVAYADLGAIRRFDTGRWSRTYADVGGGLRVGLVRGARNNVVQATLAFPLVREPGIDRVFLVLGNTVRF